eukprot:264762-Amphidinium_carterae.1
MPEEYVTKIWDLLAWKQTDRNCATLNEKCTSPRLPQLPKACKIVNFDPRMGAFMKPLPLALKSKLVRIALAMIVKPKRVAGGAFLALQCVCANVLQASCARSPSRLGTELCETLTGRKAEKSDLGI